MHSNWFSVWHLHMQTCARLDLRRFSSLLPRCSTWRSTIPASPTKNDGWSLRAQRPYLCFPTGIASGPSATVKFGFGAEFLRALIGSGRAKRFRGKFLPRLYFAPIFQQGCASFVASDLLEQNFWNRSVLGSVEGSAKVPATWAKFHFWNKIKNILTATTWRVAFWVRHVHNSRNFDLALHRTFDKATASHLPEIPETGKAIEKDVLQRIQENKRVILPQGLYCGWRPPS